MSRPLIAALVVAGALTSCGQPGEVRVIRKDGSVVDGRLAATTAASVTLETASGTVEIASSDIARIERQTESPPPAGGAAGEADGGRGGARASAETDEGGGEDRSGGGESTVRRGSAPLADDRTAGSGAGSRGAGQDTGHAGSSAAGSGGGERRFRLEMPIGTRLPLEINTTVGSNADEVGAPVRAKLLEDVKLGVIVVFAGGSTLTGVVSAAQKATLGGRGRIAVRFTSIDTDAGAVEIATSEVTRETEPDKKSGFLGKVLKGAQRGVGTVTRIGGKEAKIEAGAHVTVTLRRPFAVDPGSGR